MEFLRIMPSFDVMGDIAVIKSFFKSKEERLRLAKEIMKVNKHVRTVLSQPGGIGGEYRIRELKWLLGERKTDTIHHEYECKFYVDLKFVYYSPRLSSERMRISKKVLAEETVLNMFGGIGSFSILIARHSPALKVYSVDINPKAIHFTLKNMALNNVGEKIAAVLGDSKYLTQKIFHRKVDRVLMPLPMKSYDCLSEAVRALRNEGGFVHYYDFVHAIKYEDPIEKTINRISNKINELDVDFDVEFGRIVRSVGPNWHQIVLDIEIE